MTVPADIADYAWWTPWRPGWTDEGHCVTLVGDIAPADLIESLGAPAPVSVRGIDAFTGLLAERWEAGFDTDQAIIGVLDAGDGWSLITEFNGYLGVTERMMGPLCGARTIVAHFCNINAVRRMHWWRDGLLLVDVDLLFPTARFGAEPDALVDDLTGLGIPLTEDSDAIVALDLNAAGFALAERITGVACTPATFEQANILVSTVAMPALDAQQRYAAALHTDWHAPDL